LKREVCHIFRQASIKQTAERISLIHKRHFRKILRLITLLFNSVVKSVHRCQSKMTRAASNEHINFLIIC